MSATRRRKPAPTSARRRPAAPRRDFWGADAVEEAPTVRIRPSDDPTVMVQSLGPPPFPGGETLAQHYFAAVYQKAGALAIALAAASELLDLDAYDDTNDESQEYRLDS
jgi:hypothetical protein